MRREAPAPRGLAAGARSATRGFATNSRRRTEVITLLVLGALAFTAVLVFSVLAAVAGFVGFMITLPFRIIGWTFKLLGLLIALPFLLLFGVLGIGFAVLPILPLVGLGWR